MRLRELAVSLLPASLALALSMVPSPAAAQGISCDLGDEAREIREVRFQGNRAIAANELEQHVLATPSDLTRRYVRLAGRRRCVTAVTLGNDMAELRQFYRDRGYPQAQADTVVQSVGGGMHDVTFIIREGPPTQVATFAIGGLDAVRDSAAITAALRTRVGGTYSLAQLGSDVDSIENRLRERGYPMPDVLRDVTPREDGLTYDVKLSVLPGPLARFGSPVVDVIGPDGSRGDRISRSAIRSFMGIDSGDVFRQSQLGIAQRSLYALGAYRLVEVDIDTSRTRLDSIVRIPVLLREDETRQLDTELGWGTIDCFRTRAQYTDRGLLRTTRRLDVSGQLSKLGWGRPTASPLTRGLCYQEQLRRDSIASTRVNYNLSATVTQPGLGPDRWVRSYSAYSERRGEYQAYLRETYIGGAASLERGFSRARAVRLGYNIEYGQTKAEAAVLCLVFRACDAADRRGATRDRRLAVASVMWSGNRTSDVFDPRSGTALRVEARGSSRALGSDASQEFVKAVTDGSFFVPIGERGVFAARLRTGAVVGGERTAGGRLPPLQERLFAGGATSVRGFQENRLGALVYVVDSVLTSSVDGSDTLLYIRPDSARGYEVVPVGGSRVVIVNLELRVRDPFFPALLEYRVFMDGGELWTGSSDELGLGFDRLRWTPGLGARVFTAVGPIQVNLGYNPYRPPVGTAFWSPPAAGGGISPLLCAALDDPSTPADERRPVIRRNGVYQQADGPCRPSFAPVQPAGFLRRLSLTVSIGSDF